MANRAFPAGKTPGRAASGRKPASGQKKTSSGRQAAAQQQAAYGQQAAGVHSVKASTRYKREHKADYGRERIQILYEDADIIVIEKPSGLLSVPYPGSKARTALDLLEKLMRGRGDWSKSHRPFTVHRLDRDTSGVMVFALNEAAQKKLMAHWHDGTTRKVYRAVAENPSGGTGRPERRDNGHGNGRFEGRANGQFEGRNKGPAFSGGQDNRAAKGPAFSDEGTIDLPLAENAYHVAYVPREGDERLSEAVRAVTHYRTVMRGPTHTLFELELDTGKKNQIRAHLSFFGCPLAGDENYRARTDPFHRLALHARRLEFLHPLTGKKLSFEVPEDPAWQEYVEKGDTHPAAPVWKQERQGRQRREEGLPAAVPAANRRVSAKEKAHGSYIALGRQGH